MVKHKKSGRGRLDADLDQNVDNYEASESEEEFGKTEKIMLDQRRGNRMSDSEEEVFGMASSGDDDEDDEEMPDDHRAPVGSDLDSDIEGRDSDADSEAGLPDSKAWGQTSRKYYHTDYIDKDYGGMLSKEDEEMAEMEEQEAANIQKRLMSFMEQTDVTMGLLDKVEEKRTELAKKYVEVAESGASKADRIVKDLSSMSKSEKIQLLKQESPELFQLIDDFKENMSLAKDKLLPVINLVKGGKLAKCPAADFVQTLFSVIINYSMNIVFYLVLKSKRETSVDDHPVIQRLFTYKKVADEMLTALHQKLLDQIDDILEKTSGADLTNVDLEPLEITADSGQNLVVGNRKMRRHLKVLEKRETERLERLSEAKKKSLEAKKGETVTAVDSDDEDVLGSSDNKEDDNESDVEVEEESKRGITYAMKKNKGLTPRRKKENRNPRVKNRNKYRKAKIRRKGQVRDVRREETKYGGEISGIKAYTSKSIKFKV